MAGELDNTTEIGKALVAAGWQQGATVACDVLLASETVAAEIKSVASIVEGSQLVVASQTCDIDTNVDKEPVVEALVCVHNPPEYAGNMANSSRYFMVDEGSRLVAFAARRVLIPKTALVGVSPSGVMDDDDTRRHFTQWLADRWSRAAFPEPLVNAFIGPLGKSLRDGKKKKTPEWEAIDRTVYRFRAAWDGATNVSPLPAEVMALVRETSSPDDLLVVRRFVEGFIETANKNTKTPVAILKRLNLKTPATMAMAEAWAFPMISFDHLSTEGSETSLMAPNRE